MDAFSNPGSFIHTHSVTLWRNRFYIYSCVALGLSLWFFFQLVSRKRDAQSRRKAAPAQGAKATLADGLAPLRSLDDRVTAVKVFYGSQTGTAKGFATILASAVATLPSPVDVVDLRDYDPEDQLVGEAANGSVCVFLLATYADGQPPESTTWFCKWLEEAAHDFRVGRTYLKDLSYAVFGLGNSLYARDFNTVSRRVDKWLWMLGARRLLPRGEGDGNVAQSVHGSLEADFDAWRARFLARLRTLHQGDPTSCNGKCTEAQCTSQRKVGLDSGPPLDAQDGEEPAGSTSEDEESGTEEAPGPSAVVDVEDLGSLVGAVKTAKGEREQGEGGEPRAMITPALRDALTKQGYRLLGSHSGVKLCRWTKAMLRGRGGCYKHTFYGIESHRCMETTPSLACANKCVFCWRHHTNPVGTKWRWRMDQPEMILQEAIENHQSMIRQFKGVPGVRVDRFAEGLAVKHCALSLVGEPIMYPEINRFLQLLHQRGISSFLVTNAQFPTEIRTLGPVTQLYVSVDASTKAALKRVDRPLFKDFWQRFLDSLRALATKPQRTVYRLTLVKAWNVDELRAYADLVSLGEPDFIEVKGVTYCGESSASSLTMANVPWHDEVLHFVQELASLLPSYDIASEHEHSNCLLLAHTKYKIEGEWWTWIDYDRFQQLVREHELSGGTKTFTAADYVAKTPPWAVFGAKERGFDPRDTRFQRKNKAKAASGC
ncbi:S-adenosyl-L-methionine-dependent tRNA 4-demethylwyosine synthase TYW1 [Tachyglossus aculeatus]|uniref:S-adenosyl-L-methionine-dependent tRNA 4-demethylwyosine synthase TYW1 n=1 Tax=Tachyglossus aculeatus TaxID=9261 RepID=UPI0018F609A4|nr:S-adenosyl-L-methionine-dependent tRNA 4-demethylwyosine synthase TYW1 [Tachyglossus aculeatus]